MLIEDDPMIGDAIQGALKDASDAADWVKDGQTALMTLGCQHYDLVLLDAGLPGKDGREVLANICAKDNPVPLLIITARGGLDDYVCKPFQMAELLARMRAVLRRKGGNAAPVLSNGLVSLDPATKEASVDGGERVAVAQESGFRNEIARDGALHTVMPFLILAPVLLLIVADLVRKMFRPIAALFKGIDLRADRELHPVEDLHPPVEVRPFAVAINRLLARVGQSMESQRRFLADAAHELRSPLTAMSLQAERLAEAGMSGLARERLLILRQGIERGRSPPDQLLTLARAQSVTGLPKAPVSLQGIYRRVLEDLMPMTEAQHIDIEGMQEAEVGVSELDMIAGVKNLADNSIRYTPKGGRFDLSVEVSCAFGTTGQASRWPNETQQTG